MNTVRVCCCVLLWVASITAHGLDSETSDHVTSIINDPESTSLTVDSDIGVNGAYAIAHLLMTNKFRKSKIITLNLPSNSIKDEGATAIARALPSTKITYLDLAVNGIGKNGAGAIGIFLKHTAITHLDLSDNILGRDGAKYIFNGLIGSKVSDLNIARNALENKDLEFFSGALKRTKITTLNLDFNRIGVEGVKHLVSGLKKLINLNLARNVIGDEGAGMIAGVLKGSKLAILNLAENSITDLGVGKIATVLKDSGIIELNLGDNGIGKPGMDVLVAALKDTLVTRLSLVHNRFQLDSRMVDKINTAVKRNQKIVDNIYPRFVKLVRNDREGQLEFVMDAKSSPIEYIDFVGVISRNKPGWTSQLFVKGGGNYEFGMVKDFVKKIEFHLARVSYELKIELIDKVKLLMECVKRGLKKVVENVLMYRSKYVLRPRDETKPHPLDGVLHPAIYVLMDQYGIPWSSKDDLKHLAGIFETDKWDGWTKEEQLGKVGMNYGRKRVVGIIQEKIKQKLAHRL